MIYNIINSNHKCLRIHNNLSENIKWELTRALEPRVEDKFKAKRSVGKDKDRDKEVEAPTETNVMKYLLLLENTITSFRKSVLPIPLLWNKNNLSI